MPTLQEDLDNLDRMVDGSAAKHEIQSLIRVIAKAVTTRQADYASLAEAKAQSDESAAQLRNQIAALKKSQRQPVTAFGPESSEGKFLQLLSRNRYPMTATAISRNLAISFAKAQHIADTLKGLNYISTSMGKDGVAYQLTPKGRTWLANNGLI